MTKKQDPQAAHDWAAHDGLASRSCVMGLLEMQSQNSSCQVHSRSCCSAAADLLHKLVFVTTCNAHCKHMPA